MEDNSDRLDNRRGSRHRRARLRDDRTRRRVTALFVVLTVCSGAGVVAEVAAGGAGRPAGALPALTTDVTVDDGTLSIDFAGDTMLGDTASWTLLTKGFDWPLALVKPLLAGDFSIINAEGPITQRTEWWDTAERWSYNSLPLAAPALARAGVDALNLGTNHAFDRGPAGLSDTLAHATASGLETIGAAANLAEAERPLIVRSEIGAVGIVSLVDDPTGAEMRARAHRPGVSALNPESIARGVALARSAGADWVVAFVQWGENYTGVEGQQRDSALLFDEAGYDLVVGAGAHALQPIEMVGSMPVVYSIGNFVFGTPGRFTPEAPPRGAVVTARFDADGLMGLGLRCIVTDNATTGFQTQPCPRAEAVTALQKLHPDVMMIGSAGWLPTADG